jgi:hypothetical protein
VSRVKTSLDHKSIRRLIWLVLTVSVLLGYSLQSAAGSAYYSNEMQNYATVSSPPVILEEGNVSGAGTIYANKTSAKVSVAAPVWLGGWDERVKITIDNNDVDSALSNFPVLVYLSNSSSGRNNDDVSFVFDELQSDANRKKIAVTTSDGTTQCYVEIERWDNASEQAWLWVKVPSISSTADTDLYLYYDSFQSDNTAYVGDKESTPAQNVWTTNFKGVWHLDEDPSGTSPQMKDSTSNNNNGTSNGNMTSGDQVAGKIDGSLNFDGSDDYINTTSNELKTLNNFTLSVWFKADSTTTPSHHILWEGPASQNGWGDGSGNPNSHEMHLTICKFDANNTLNFFYGYEESGGDWVPAVEIIMSFSDTTNWNHAVVVMTGAGTSPSAELFLNGVSQGTDTGTQTNRTAWNTNLRIGRPGPSQRYFDGMTDEVRILETAVSASWVKASYESERDDLLDFGSEERNIIDHVDNNTSDIGSPTDRGTHSNFTAQQASPDSIYDTLTEENTGAGEGGAIEDYVDNNISDVDSSTDLGSHSNFENQKDKDSIYDTLTEENTGGTGTDVEDYVDATSDVDSSPDIGNHSNFENQKAKDTTYDTLTEETVVGGDWGITDALTFPYNIPNYRYLGGTSPDIEGMNITKIHIYCSTAGTMAVGVWTGGSLGNPVGAVKRTEAYNVSVVADWNEIDVPDYNWPANTVTWIGWTCDGTVNVYYSTSSSDSGDFQSATGRWSQTNPATADPTQPMNSTIGAGGFDAYWYSMYLEYDRPDSYQLDLEVQFTGLDYDEINEELCIYAGSTDADNITVDYWTGSGWSNLLADLAPNTWNNVSVSLTSATFTIRFVDGTPNGDTNQDSWQIDACLVHVWGNPQNWELDLEVQFTDFIDFLATEKLCIYTGTLGSEDLRVGYWNGTGWETLTTDLTANSWNNYTVSLTSSTFTVRFKDGTIVGDIATQDQWQIDASLLRIEGAGSKEDAVDQQSNVDGSADVGTHSNFTAQQYGPDSINDTLTEENTGVFSNSTLLDDGFEAVDWDANWDAIAHNWQEDNSIVHSGSASAFADYGSSGYFTCDDLNASGASAIYVDFWYRLSNTETDDLVLYYYNGSVYDEISQIGGGTEGTWLHYTEKVTDSQYFIPNFRIRFNAGNDAFEDIWVDDVLIKKEIQSADNYELDLEVRWTDLPYTLPNEELCIYAGTMGTEDIKVDVWNGSSWVNVISDMNASDWNNVTITSYLTSSNFTIRFKGGTETGDPSEDTWDIDVALIHVWNEVEDNYELDLEVQWTNADYDKTDEELCIYYYEGNNTHSLDATGGYMIVGDGTPDWGSTTGTISFWIKWDAVANRSWGQHDNMETRFSDSNLVVDWGAAGSITSSTSFTAGKWYFIAIVWDENTDNLYLYVGDQDNAPTEDTHITGWTSTVSTLGVTQNNFMASKNGVEPTDGHGDELRYWNTDRTLTQIQSDYNIELTGSETNLRSYFKLNNNFDDIGPDNNDGSGSGSYSFSSDVAFGAPPTENIRVDAWNGTAWQNVFTNLTNGWNNASVAPYLTSSNFTIRFKGGTETGDTNQDSWNIDATLLHVWTSNGTYDYVLKVVNQVADNWTVNLQVYDSSNIDRLSSLNISLHDGTSSNQIAVSGGNITQSEGPPYNLTENATIYIAITNLQATTTGTSHLYVHLKIQVPDTSTYMLYVITFEIT